MDSNDAVKLFSNDRPLYVIAEEISKDWKRIYSITSRNVYFGAAPYLDAMFSLNVITDDYGSDSGRSIVAYFLSNAAT